MPYWEWLAERWWLIPIIGGWVALGYLFIGNRTLWRHR